MSDLLDGLIGGLGGGVLVGGAQMLSFWLGGRDSRRDVQRQVIPDLLADLYFVETSMELLGLTIHSPGSPLSYGERGTKAQPMLDRLREASAQRVPLLTDASLRDQFDDFRDLCAEVAGPRVDAQVLDQAAAQVVDYGRHLQKSLLAVYHNNKPLPRLAKPVLVKRAKPQPDNVATPS